MNPRFESLSGSVSGLHIYDPIESCEFSLRTPTSVTPAQVAADTFPAPVSTVCHIETQTIEIPTLATCYVHTPDWEFVTSTVDHDPSLPSGEYLIELGIAPMKLFLYVENSVDVSTEDTRVRLTFGGETTVAVGARSLHNQPAGTITVRDDHVEDVMQAVSTFGSALQTTSPERSFPTLRGHPPLVEVGKEFHVPDGIETPDTGVRLELPAENEYVYPSVSLAYYLGAEVVPADEPRLVTDDGLDYDLAGALGYEDTVSRVLKQSFALDCVTRTEGFYPVELHEREQIEPHVDLDFEALYEASLSERLAAYLSVPYSVVEQAVPEWPVLIDLDATPQNVSMLSFAAGDLSIVRIPPTPDEVELNEPLDEVTDFKRSQVPANGDVGSSTADLEDVDENEIFTPRDAPALEHVWVAKGVPAGGANKGTVEAFRRRLDRSTADTDITIHVVCNDDSMAEEDVVEQFYGVRDLVQFDVTLHHNLSTDELRTLLGSSADFLHYIGHVNENGMQCSDGHLDAHDFDADEVGVRALLLNACRSFEQGTALIEAGASAAIVTFVELPNTQGTIVGRALSRLLNLGFPLQYATDLVQSCTAGYSYLTVGDGGISLCQSQSGCPFVVRISPSGEKYEMTLETVTVQSYGLGSQFTPSLDDSRHYLVPGEVNTFELTSEELDDYLDLDLMPVVTGGDLLWSNEITASDLN